MRAEPCTRCAANTRPSRGTAGGPTGNTATSRTKARHTGRDREWYGWQNLVVDGVVLTAGAIGIATAEGGSGIGTLGLSFAGYVLGSPIVHLVHGRAPIAAASVGLRLLSPLAGVGLTVGAGHGRPVGSTGYRGAMIALGLAVPIIVDAALLAWEPAPQTRIALGVSADARAGLLCLTLGGQL